MKLAIFLTGALFAGTANAATLSGVVVNENDVPIPNLRLILRAPDSRLTREGVTDRKGRFVFLGVRPASLYTLTDLNAQVGSAIADVGPSDEIKLHGLLRFGICGGIYWNEDVDPQKRASSYPATSHIRVFNCE